MKVCIFVCVYVGMYIFCVCMCLCMFICIHACLTLHVNTCICVFQYVSINPCMFISEYQLYVCIDCIWVGGCMQRVCMYACKRVCGRYTS